MNLGGIYFISNEIGWFVTLSSDKVYRTTDGGVNWEIISLLGYNLNQIYFFDESKWNNLWSKDTLPKQQMVGLPGKMYTI